MMLDLHLTWLNLTSGTVIFPDSKMNCYLRTFVGRIMENQTGILTRCLILPILQYTVLTWSYRLLLSNEEMF